MSNQESMRVQELANGESIRKPSLNYKFTIGAEDTNTNIILVTIQAYDGNQVLEEYRQFILEVCASNSRAISAVTTMTVSTGTELVALTAEAVSLVETDDAGKAIISLTQAGGTTRELRVLTPSGEPVGSGTITFAA